MFLLKQKYLGVFLLEQKYLGGDADSFLALITGHGSFFWTVQGSILYGELQKHFD